MKQPESPDGFRNGYVRSSVTPLKPDPPGGPWWPAWPGRWRCWALWCGAVVAVAAACWQSSGWAQSLVLALSPLFSLGCAFFFLTCYLARSQRGSVWLLALPVCCHCGDALGAQLLPGGEVARLLAVLLCVGLLTLWKALWLGHSVLVLLFSSLVWLISLTSLSWVPHALRALGGCLVGLAGSLLALGFCHGFHIREKEARSGPTMEDKVPVIRPRRRSSCVSLGETTSTFYGSGKMSRRPSLPCISREQVRG